MLASIEDHGITPGEAAKMKGGFLGPVNYRRIDVSVLDAKDTIFKFIPRPERNVTYRYPDYVVYTPLVGTYLR